MRKSVILRIVVYHFPIIKLRKHYIKYSGFVNVKMLINTLLNKFLLKKAKIIMHKILLFYANFDII